MSTSLLLALLSIIQLVAGLGASLYVLTALGPGIDVDAFVAAQTVPLTVVAIVGTSLANILVPVLASLKPTEVGAATWPVALWAGATFAVIASLVGFGAPYWVPLLFPGFDAAADALTIELLAILAPGILFSGLSTVAISISRARDQFVLVESIGALAACLNVAGLVLLLKSYGITAAAWLWTGRFAMQASMIFPIAGRIAYSSSSLAVIRTIWIRLRPLIFSATIFKLGPVLDRYFLSSAPPGGLSLFNFASTACGAGASIVEKALVTPIVPSLTRAYVRRDIDTMLKLVRSRVLLGMLITALGIASIAIFRPFIVDLVQTRGGMSFEQADLLVSLALILTGAAATMATGPVVVSAFYAMGNSLIPTALGMGGFALSIGLKIAGYKIAGIYGLAIATTLHYLLNLGVGLILLERDLREKRRSISTHP
ncbi:lipid II flippase MurJ [Hydrocarboniphaga sp.]|uniref:lipid II flippase MurJ n=1 Tax=Hydrocarboniphaga sp. TaxID=2033016 RepID=UPI002ABCEE88|nr:lipid II flippase MurJ [Hydrocarboniphaga sp.]MDZ4077994.1 lipid II flippase MurJ [Hydrocarboniphaga sp.]